MKFTAQQIAEIINGEIIGDPNIEIKSLAKIEEGKKGDLSFLANPKYTLHVYTSKASIIVVDHSFSAEKKVQATLITVKNAYTAFGKLSKLYNQNNFNETGISKKAEISYDSIIKNNVFIGAFTVIEKGVLIEDNVKIHPNCYIGKNVTIKKNTILFPGVKIYHNCIIGQNNMLHSGVVIGSDGFGFAPNGKTEYNKISQIGNVMTGNNVEIGANSTIDRATMGSTKIGNGVKLDNLIQVAHNVEIGNHTVIAAQTCIAGSSKIGEKCMIGGQVAIAGHLTIANKVKIAGQSGIASSIMKEKAIVQGPMAFNIKEFQRSYILFKKLPELYKKINKLEKETTL